MKRVICIFVLATAMQVQAGYEYVITDGWIPGFTLHGYESFLITGGGVDNIDLWDQSSGRIDGTAALEDGVGGIRKIRISDYSTLEMQGGELGTLTMNYQGTAKLSGGSISEIDSFQNAWKTIGQPPLLVPNPHIEIICRDWNYNTLSKMLTGTWQDYSTFNIHLLNRQGYSPVMENIQFTIIPEPATFALIGLGGLLVRRRK
jgi:hypothetical protein